MSSTQNQSVEIDAGTILAVIPTYNEEDYIEACIRSLMDGDEDLKKASLIVADGGSTDRTVDIVETLRGEFPNLELLNNPKKLQSAALNLAAKTLQSKATQWLVRCDAHSIYPKNFILSVAESLINTGADSVVIPMDAVGTTCFEKANAWIVDTPLGSGGSAHRGGTQSQYVDHGHHAGFKLSTFLKLDGYDETFSHNEDAEYDTRVKQMGGEIFLDADIRIKYTPRGTLSRLSKQYFNYGKGRARTVRKHKSKLKIRQSLPVLVLLACLCGLMAAPLFWPALIVPMGYIGSLCLVSCYLAFSRRSLCGLFAGPALGAMHMSWAIGFIKQMIRSNYE